MSISADSLWVSIKQLRTQRPLVHNISNLVAMTPIANALLALGAAPIMAHGLDEVAQITASADALVVNLGTPDDTRVAAIRRAMAQAAELGKPVILDPVGVQASDYRLRLARQLLATTPVTMIRANAAEILSLAGEISAARGVDGDEAGSAALLAARRLAANLARVVVVSGQRDLLVTATASLAIDNGHPLMARVTAMGCIASALCGAFAALDGDPLRAAAHAMATMALAGELAAIPAAGPGSFAMHLLDALYHLERAPLERLRITPID